MSAPPATAAARANWPDVLPMTSTTNTRSRADAVSRMRKMASSTVLSAVSNPIETSVPPTSLSIVAGTPTTWTPCSTRAWPPASEPSPPMTTRPWTPNLSSVATARRWPAAVANSLLRDVPRKVPPRSRTPPTVRLSRAITSPSMSPRKPQLKPITRHCLKIARRATARTAAFMPGESPPLVSTPIVRRDSGSAVARTVSALHPRRGRCGSGRCSVILRPPAYPCATGRSEASTAPPAADGRRGARQRPGAPGPKRGPAPVW